MKRKKYITEGAKLKFVSGNFEGLTGEVTKTNWDSKDERAIFGYLHEVKLSNGTIGFIEKSEHFVFI